MTNILLTSAGRRVELLESFEREAKLRDPRIRVFATDLRPEYSAAAQRATLALKAPPVTQAGYIDFLWQTCRNHGIGLVVPTIDTELLVLAQHRDAFAAEGIQLVVSAESLVRQCRDKRETSELFSSLNIDTPAIYNREQLQFPCFAKPYDGSCSVGAVRIARASDVTESLLQDAKTMFMELIDARVPEYTVDAYYSRVGELTCLVPRRRLEVRAGEVSKGVTRRDHVYDYLLPRLRKLEGARGCLTLQLFADDTTGRFAALEINPRFGGGFPLSYEAGANYPGWLIDEYLLGRSVGFFDDWEPDLLMLRYDAKVLVRGVG